MEEPHEETNLNDPGRRIADYRRAAALAAGTLHSPTSLGRASDILILSRAQQRRAWDDLHRVAVSQYLPPGFSASIEWVLPNSVRIKPVSRKARRQVPALKPYDFAIVHNTLVIVNPYDRIIAEVIPRWRGFVA
jgi:hypothetical protein